ncbi:MAG: diguanylate cyclase [Clostridia bacterium]|nr:diguanylate cyclase [Clostridia bacterium]
MKSISVKIIGLTLLAILISMLTIGGIGILSIMHEAKEDANKELMLICDNRRKSIDAYLNSIEQSVNMIAHYASERLDTLELVEGGAAGLPADQLEFTDRDWDSSRQAKLDHYLASYLEQVDACFQSVSNHTNGTVSYYFRLSPAISRDMTGFLYSKVGRTSFVELELTDISLYEPDDLSHVGWYYIPIRKGRPTWIGPYENMNLGTQMLSYVVPIYRAGVVVGVIGMDISAETLIEQIENLEIYDTGYAFLVDENANVVYHPTVQSGKSVDTYDLQLAENALMVHDRHGDAVMLINYKFDGIDKLAACAFLSDGLEIIVTAPRSEINATSHGFANTVLIAGCLIALVFSLATVVMMRRIIRPLKNLAEVARQLTEGNYDVNLTTQSQDEVGILTNSFQHLIDHLKVYISDLNSKAYSDALTKVKNKAGFEIFTRKLDDQINAAEKDTRPNFAIIMFDCNDLKTINDTYGHAKGDVYLQNACTAICRVFAHSPVFRVGGDEFTVILQGEDYVRREELVEELKAYEKAHNLEHPSPWDQIGLSVGMAIYDTAKDEGVEGVLKRADERMYEEKRKYKQSQMKNR